MWKLDFFAFGRERSSLVLSFRVLCNVESRSSWGNDFRADYRNLVIFKKKFKDVPVMALTATATISVREDVVRSLGLKKCCVFQSSFNRPNLFYEVRPKRLKSFHKDIYELIKTDKRLLSKSGIIYCGSKKECELLSESLNEKAYGDGVRAIAGKVECGACSL